ncbi:hypothetical protein C8F01DRAFT_1093765 [Mycena amicta]|nr:hypothetical protein C8F01DRAFT_1093765 [Mycena amicta]
MTPQVRFSFYASENDEDQDEDEMEEFDIKYVIPYKTASKDLTLKSTTTYTKFLRAVAKTMGVSVSHLSDLAFLPSYIPRSHKPRPTMLVSQEDYDTMLGGIVEYRNDCQAKNKGNGKVKPFTIGLSDVSGQHDGEGSGAVISNRITKGKKSKKEKPALDIDSEEQQDAKIMKAIEDEHRCDTHQNKTCFVMPDGSHYQLTNQDLASGTTLVRLGKATSKNVMEMLKLEDKAGKQTAVKRNVQANSGMNMGAPYYGMPYGGAPPWLFQPPVPPMYSGQPGWNMGFPPHTQSTSSSALTITTPSPTRKRKYPTTAHWLRNLDDDEDRGADGDNYQQYLDVLEKNGLTKLDDLVAVDDTEKLVKITGFSWGVASRMLRFAKEDDRKLKKKRTD